MLKNQALIADINSCALQDKQIAFWWLGQHSFIVKLGKTVIYLDPYLSANPHRQVEPLLTPADIQAPAAICGTHDHSDHIDIPLWKEIVPVLSSTLFVLPERVRASVAHRIGVNPDRLTGLNDAGCVEVDGVEIHAIPAAHELLDLDPATGLYPYLGYIIKGNGCTIYHSGDSCIYEGIHDRLRAAAPHLMLLPINGRDAVRLKRNCIGNMTYQEAVDLAGAIHPRLTIPTHWDMFAGNSADPQQFMDYMQVKYPQLTSQIPEHGKRVVLTVP